MSEFSCLPYYRRYFVEACSFSAFNFFQYSVKFFLYEQSEFIVLLAINNYFGWWFLISRGFCADSWNILSPSVVFLFGWHLFVLLPRCFYLHSLHFLSTIQIVIVYLPSNFWFYSFGFGCILLVFVRSLLTFLCFNILPFVVFFNYVRILSRFSLTAIDSLRTLYFTLGLVAMYTATASIWVVTKFSYLSFGVCLFRWLVKSSKLVSYSVTIYSLLISLLPSKSLMAFFLISL